jgi:hypothetical protein
MNSDDEQPVLHHADRPVKKKKRKTGAAKRLTRKVMEAHLIEYQRRLNRLNLASHPLQEMMEAEDNPPAPAGPSTEAEGSGEPEKEAEAANEDSDDTDLKVAKVLSAVLNFAGKGQSSASRAPAFDMSKVINRPSTYDGVAGKYHEWKNEIQIYLRVMNFPKESEAPLVVSYLRGTALNWWLQKTAKFQADSVEIPQTWAELLPHLDERFEHRNPELAARDRLMNLRQNGLTLHQYLKEFEGCYAYIPKWDEADKIHRFIYGLKPYYRSKFCVDPATHMWWTSFDSLVAYISSYVSDDALAPDMVDDATQNLRKTIGLNGNRGRPNKPGNKGGWQKKKLNAVLNKINGNGTLGEADRKLLNTVLKGGINKKYGSANQVSSYTNANGESVTRNKHVRSFCHAQEPPLCLGCYQSGHYVNKCTNPVAQGTPEGYKAPARK